MKVSIIVPTKNEKKNIGKLLKSLKAQTFKNFETIIVDNFSQDNTLKIAKKFTKKVFQFGPERSSQRNFGTSKAKGTYIMFIDADMELEPKILSDVVKTLDENRNVSGIIIQEISKGSSFLTKVKALEKDLLTGTTYLEAPRAFRKKDLLRIGGYDQSLIAAEDWDLALRIKKFGEFKRIPSVIYHQETDSLWHDILKKYYYAQNIHKYAAKNPQIFKKQASVNRFIILFNKPELILVHPLEFTGLLVLKTAHFLAYIVASLHAKNPFVKIQSK